MKKELAKTYDPKSIEERLYNSWLEKKYFRATVNKDKTPYTIMMPPPNITGQLHLGHCMYTIQDIMIRFKRMQGFEALWLPGTDHASISTEVRIVNAMAKEGLTKADLGRDEFLRRAWAWKDEYGGRIVSQLKKLGASCDWDRERFTMDEGLSDAVLEVFVRLYEKGWIYRGEKLINWCPHCKTTISDAEVDHEDKNGAFWHFKYPIDGTDEFLTFATTRPETMLGDTAIAVNPDDERYKKFIGKTVTVPIVKREIPIIADSYVDIEFGTGVVKITPAHDPNDFEIGIRHNLPIINIMDDDGSMNENAATYKGLDRYEARKKIIAEFKDLGLFVKEEPITHSVGIHERCNIVIEPLIKLQWFVKMEDMAKPAIDVINQGKLRIYPERFTKNYMGWLENIRDWCISRQLWWGHRIPAYYCEDCGEITVSKTAPDKCAKCKSTTLRQDEDTLDTWFSSALWPFSTLGWPNDNEDLSYFYPTDTLVTGYDIIFFWVVRMVFSGMEQMGDIPFKDVLINGLIRDEQGRKLSKSLGNGADPLEVIDKYGADALRFCLITGNAPGNDIRFNWTKVESSRNFINKVWNATRFIMMNMTDEEIENTPDNLTATDKWILTKMNEIVKEVTANIEAYELGIAVQKIYDFTWDEFCDWYIEMVKPRLYNKEDKTRDAALYTLKAVLINILKLLHPYIPFVTEEIFLTVQNKEETIMLSRWPRYDDGLRFEAETNEIELVKDAVKAIRNIRGEMNVPPAKKVKIFVVSSDEKIAQSFKRAESYVKTLAGSSEVFIQSDTAGIDDGAVSIVIPGGTIYLPFDELVDVEKEILRLSAEVKKYENEIERAEKKLANEGFVKKAPQALIDEEKGKIEKYKEMLRGAKEQVERLGTHH
ncbi:MAG: valine--tRNA ligase [Defluviitaleaceae bacterium]|nr:valine--tRNA ligase [Defluviitaleaceae bacterium]